MIENLEQKGSVEDKNTWEEYKNIPRRPIYMYLEEST